MTTTLVQLKLRGIFLPNDSSETLTNSVNDVFSDITSTISNFFYNLISVFSDLPSTINNFFSNLINVFNQKLPPEDRDELIHRLLSGSTPYLIVLVVLITWLCCWCCLFSCISSIIVGLFNVVVSVFRSVFGCLCCCCRRSSGRMMRAPGRFPKKMSRSAFEGNPRGYFRDLRGQPNNFVY